MSSPTQAANYTLLTLKKGDKEEIPLNGKTTSFDYYESVLSPNVTAIMTFVDTGGSTQYDKEYDKQERFGSIYNALPLTGDGTEEIKFKITSALGTLDFSRTPLYVNGAINPDQESQRESVILSLVSKTAITNQETHVKKNYSGSMSNSNSVNFIATDLLKIPSNRLNVEKTSNNYPFIGNNKSPFDVIMMLASKSVPTEGNPGFFFYETRDGHSFRSIDSLISQEPVAKYHRSDENRSSINTNNDFKISSFSINKNQNLINSLKSGVYTSRRISFNPKTFREEETEFTIGTLPKSLGKNEPAAPENKKYTRTLFSIKDVGVLSPTVAAGGATGNPEDWQGKVQMRYNLLFTQVAHLQVPLNPNLRAGNVIECSFEIITRSEKVQGASDPVQSGKYLIVDLCHHYDDKQSFTSMTVVRDTYGKYTSKV